MFKNWKLKVMIIVKPLKYSKYFRGLRKKNTWHDTKLEYFL